MLPNTAYAATAAVFAAGLLEGTGVPWPGVFIIAGAAATLGGTGIPLVAGLFAAGYCLGALVQYVLGRLVGPVVLSWLPAAQRTRLDALTAKHGTAMVLWTRPTAAGNYVSIPAGMMRMPLFRFVLYTFLGITPWAAGMATAGWLLGGQIDAISQWFVPFIVLCGALLAVLNITKMLLQRHRQAVAA